MKKLTALLLLMVVLLCGCKSGRYITVDFKENQPLEYKFVSERDVDVVWKDKSDPNKSKTQEFQEKLEYTMRYEPVEVDSFGLSKIKATVGNLKVSRSDKKHPQDATYSLEGKSFYMTVDPSGKIQELTDFEKIYKEAGEKAFRKKGKQKIKNPDMLGDFLASQYFLWDAQASRSAVRAAKPGQTWTSVLSLPLPMLAYRARKVEYTLEDFDEKPEGTLAVITSDYEISDDPNLITWPTAYTGRFMVAGTFGFLRGFDVQKFEGSGTEIFNVDKGLVEKQTQQFNAVIETYIPFTTKVRPMVYIDHKLTMNLIESESGKGE